MLRKQLEATGKIVDDVLWCDNHETHTLYNAIWLLQYTTAFLFPSQLGPTSKKSRWAACERSASSACQKRTTTCNTVICKKTQQNQHPAQTKKDQNFRPYQSP